MKGVAHNLTPAGISRRSGHLTVGSYLAPWDFFNHGVNFFKGVHYEMEVMANGYEWLVHSTNMFPVGTKVGIKVDPFNIQIMNKPVSEDEEAVGVEE